MGSCRAVCFKRVRLLTVSRPLAQIALYNGHVQTASVLIAAGAFLTAVSKDGTDCEGAAALAEKRGAPGVLAMLRAESKSKTMYF